MKSCIVNKKYSCICFTFFLFLLSLFTSGLSEEVCKISYKGKPEDLNDSTIIVPEEVVAQSEYVYVPSPADTIQRPLNPSLFFIIDHSSSMYTTFTKDKWGNRFRVVHDLIDSLKNKFPKAEVGISVFTEYLYFRPESNPILVQCPGIDSGSYIPFFSLDSSYAPTSEMGWQILQHWMETDTVIGTPQDPNLEFVDLKYRPDPLWDDFVSNGSNTNINAGFEAAKHAMLSAKYAPNQQFIIFISDGVVSPATLPTDFVNGVNTPTTFTIFLTDNPGDPPPPQLQTMNTNIQNNGYSSHNPKSQLWGFQNASYEALMTFLMENVISVITQPVPTSYPTGITVNGVNPITPWDTTGFTFAKMFPLTGEVTPFVYSIDYRMTKDSITAGGDTIQIQYDTTVTIQFEIEVQNGAPDLSDTFDVKSWDRQLGFYYNGSAVDTVNETMANLEIRFTFNPGDAEYQYTNADVEVINIEGPGFDKETYTLAKSGNSFTGTFPRVVIENTNPTVGDGILQHYIHDSIGVIFRNNEDPKLPLDSVRIAVPYKPTTAIHSNSVFSNGEYGIYLIKSGINQYSLRFNNLPNKGKVTLYAINGRNVIQKHLGKGNSEVLLPRAISPGIYLLHLNSYGNNIKKKLLLQ